MAQPEHVLNVRNVSDDLLRRLKVGTARQGVPYAAYLARLEHLHRVIEREARKKGQSATVSFARAALAEAELRVDPESG